MPNAVPKDSGEKLQIAILTLAMTAGGFALLTIIFVFFLNPSAEADLSRQQKSYEALTQKLLSAEMKELRANAKRSEAQPTTNSLGEIVKDALDRFGLKYPKFPPVTPKTIKAGLEELRLKISVEPAKLQQILQFVAVVQDAKKTIQVENVNFKRDTRSKAEDELWTGSAEFVDYVTK
jgi:type II secretory pathway component PulM